MAYNRNISRIVEAEYWVLMIELAAINDQFTIGGPTSSSIRTGAFLRRARAIAILCKVKPLVVIIDHVQYHVA